MTDLWNKSLSFQDDRSLEAVKKQAMRRGAADSWWEPHPESPRFLVSWSAWPLPQWAQSPSVPGIWCERIPVEEYVAFLRPHVLRTEHDIWASRARGYQGVRLAAYTPGVSLQYLLEVSRELGMLPVVQVLSKEDVRRVVDTDAQVIECLASNTLGFIQDFDWDVLCGYCQSVQEIQQAIEKGYMWFSVSDTLWLDLIKPQRRAVDQER
ncbi:MAG: hypothetical protein AB8G05_20335 [Oligoflexales bacterium]